MLHRSFLSEKSSGGYQSGLTAHNAGDINSESDAKIALAALHNKTITSNTSTIPKYLDEETFTISDRVFKQGVQAAPLQELNEDQRYSIWHPRYRMPVNGIFGYSKPFLHNSLKKLQKHPTFFEESVLRMRDGFQKLPLGGSFTRASKGLTAEWYPMDQQDLEAVRRRGYFHETIGDIQKWSYRDLTGQMKIAESQKQRGGVQGGGSGADDLTNVSNILERSGSQVLTPQKGHRRGSMGQHMSRYINLYFPICVYKYYYC